MPRLNGQNGNDETHNSGTDTHHLAVDIGSGIGGLGRRDAGLRGRGGSDSGGGGNSGGSGAAHCRGGSTCRGGAES